MNVKKVITLVAGATMAGACFGVPAISKTSVRAYHAAIQEANNGEIKRATATLNCILMPDSVSIGVARQGALSNVVRRGVDVWNSRLSRAPFVVASVNPDIKVQTVHAIKNGAEVQGEVHLERQVYWGSSGTRYRVRGTILIRDIVDGRPITATEATSVLEHELGHVLGLEDDVNPDHLMGPFVVGSPVDGPSYEEVNTLSAFRNAVQDVLDQIGSRVTLASRGDGKRGRRSSYRPFRSRRAQ